MDAAPGLSSPIALLTMRARLVAGSAATQARVAERRSQEARARLRGVAALGASVAVASLCCGAAALLSTLAPDLVPLGVGCAAAAAAVLLSCVPALLLVRAAMTRPILDEAPRAAMASAATLAALGAGFGRAIAAMSDEEPLPEMVRTAEALLAVLESEAGLAAQSARPQGSTMPARRHQRIVPLERRVVVTTADRRKLIGTIADVSLSGVALTANLPRIAVGDAATVGTRAAVVARVWERGVAFQFARELDPAVFDEAIVL